MKNRIAATRNDLRDEYRKLDKRLTAFRLQWNRQARKDIEFANRHHRSNGKQPDFPALWYQDVERWRELRKILKIR